MSEQKKDRRELEEIIIAKALQNEDGYRERLLENPRSVVGSEIAAMEPEATLPESYEVKIIEEPQSAFYIVLPHVPDPQVELSDEDLENVAGGIIEISDKIGDTTVTAII